MDKQPDKQLSLRKLWKEVTTPPDYAVGPYRQAFERAYVPFKVGAIAIGVDVVVLVGNFATGFTKPEAQDYLRPTFLGLMSGGMAAMLTSVALVGRADNRARQFNAGVLPELSRSELDGMLDKKTE